MNTKRLLAIFIFLCFWNIIYSQINTDSLWQVWNNPKQPDTSRLEALYKIGVALQHTEPDSTLAIAKLMDSESGDFDLYQAKALFLESIYYRKKNDKSNAILKGEEALKILDTIEGDIFKVNVLQRLGLLHFIIGNHNKALLYYERIINIKVAPDSILEYTYTGIAVLYERQKNFSKSSEYHLKSLELSKKNKNTKALPIRLNNVGASYFYQEEYPRALEYYLEAKKISKEINNEFGLGLSLINIGEVYEKLGKNNQALKAYKNGLNVIKWEHPDSRTLIVYALKQIGSIYKAKENHRQALKWCQNSLVAAEKLQSVEYQRDACNCLYETYKSMQDASRALEYHEKMLVFKDSLKPDETFQVLQQMEFRKQQLADSLKQVENSLKVELAHQAELNQKNRTHNILLGSGGFILLLAIGLWSRLHYIRKSKAEIEKEKDRSESLLLNILPAEVAQELKEKGKAAARNYSRVTILFTDFKSFTELSENVSPEELVAEVNACFEAFDDIVDKYGIEKIKTIGDSYMAAGNLPVPSSNSTKNTVLAALDMQDFISNRKKERDIKGLLAFEMRIGIHTGPVVAGIVGIKKFQYDLWGDTVNTASRLENRSITGQVNISQDTYELLKNDADLLFEKRGKVEVKGKGMMEMYFVKRK